MRIGLFIRIVCIFTIFGMTDTRRTGFYNYDDYFDLNRKVKGATDNLYAIRKPNKYLFNGLTASGVNAQAESPAPATETTECDPSSSTMPLEEPESTNDMQQPLPPYNPQQISINDKDRELKKILQLLYIAQERVQIVTAGIKKAQAVANSAEQCLEEATNRMREMTANLQKSQQEVDSAAMRAKSAQLKINAHNQLLSAAREDVHALSTQLDELQKVDPKATDDLRDLLKRFKQSRQESMKSIPMRVQLQQSAQAARRQQKNKLQPYNSQHHKRFYYN